MQPSSRAIPHVSSIGNDLRALGLDELPQSELTPPRMPTLALARPSRTPDAQDPDGVRRRMTMGVVAVGFGTLAWTIAQGEQDSWLNFVSFLIVAIAAAVPWILWLTRQGGSGLPIFPAYCLPFVWGFAAPMLIGHGTVLTFSPEERFWAALIAAIHLACATFVWSRTWRKPLPGWTSIWVLKVGNRDYPFVIFLVAGCVFEVSMRAGWVGDMFGTFTGVVRAIASTASMIGIVVLSMRLGQGRWPVLFRGGFIALVLFYMSVTIMSLILIYAFVICAAIAFGYLLGSGRIPWKYLAFAFFALAFLHLGKERTRAYYWGELGARPIAPAQYVDVLELWAANSVRRLGAQDDDEWRYQSARSVFERASSLQLFLLVQADVPDRVPPLLGETYAIVPVVMIPGFLYPGRPITHTGTNMMSRAFGMHAYDGNVTASIAWGLMTESYANFMLAGPVLLGLLLGGFFARIERWSYGVPVHSFRAFFSILVMMLAVTESSSMGVTASVLSQAFIALLLLLPLMLRRRREDLESELSFE